MIEDMILFYMLHKLSGLLAAAMIGEHVDIHTSYFDHSELEEMGVSPNWLKPGKVVEVKVEWIDDLEDATVERKMSYSEGD